VAIVIVDADADECRHRLRRVQEYVGRAGVRSVVPDLEDVDRREHRSVRQRRLHRSLGVAGEEGGELRESEDHHH
jgi:hypothetical protein